MCVRGSDVATRGVSSFASERRWEDGSEVAVIVLCLATISLLSRDSG